MNTNTNAALLAALIEAQAGLEFAAAQLPQKTAFVPSHIAALKIVNAALSTAAQPPAAATKEMMVAAVKFANGPAVYKNVAEAALIIEEQIYGEVYEAMLAAAPKAAKAEPVKTFQARVQPWMLACFGDEIAGDKLERNHRFLEEALELVQACGCTASEAHQLVTYVFDRPVGEPVQEAGGVMVTLAALCLANGLDMHAAAEIELARIWTKVEAIRAKQAAKPKHSPLPQVVKAEPVPLTADDLREPKNGANWRVEWWNESARLMLPANKRLDSFQSYKNGTLMFTLKEHPND